ncbi:MAG: DUF4397 domain-containing protein [Bacteroidetes bacterium]|nr:DUF4397 domain-containing protein [Bacteroidota bacterium]
MKYITNLFGVGCVVLFAMLFIAPGAFAQTTYYVDPDNGSGTACASTETNGGHPTPCLLDQAVSSATTAGDVILIRVRRSGGAVTVASPAAELGNANRFGAYVRGSGDRVKGALEFTGNFQIGTSGQFELDSLSTVQFADVTNLRTDGTSPLLVDPAPNEKNPASRLMISGTLTTTSATIGSLVVADDLTIEGSAADAMLRVDSLVVNSGATLTVGGATAATEIDLRVPLKKAGENDPKGILTVNGTIDGPGTVWIAHAATSDGAGRGANGDATATPPVPDDDYFHMSSDYMPDSKNVANQEDCVWITGGGEIENEIRAIAAGNICVTLGNIGDITVAGSITEPTGGFTETLNITTDVIFRNNVEVDGDVVQWNDARVVFEKNATVTGSVILEDGTLPTNMFPAAFGAARTRTGTAEDGPDGETVATSVRMGVKLASAAEDVPFTCTYRATMDEVRVLDTPVVSLSVASATVDEDVGTVTVTATLNKEHPAGTTVTVPLTASGTATAGTDYAALPDPFQIEISSGTTGTVDISVTDDSDDEGAETIIVTLGMLDEDVVRAGATNSVTITINASDGSENVFVDDGTSDMRFFKAQGTAAAGAGFYIPGVQFKGMATIEEDLYVQSSEITNRPSAANRDDTRCAPRVIFAAAPAGKASSAMMSYVQRDVVIEEEHMDRILLDAEMGANDVISAHNLSVDGDLFATGDPFEMESAAVAMDNGMCSNIFSLNAGTRLVLSDDDGHVADGAALMLDALVTNEDLEVNGALTVATLHVADGVEVESDATNSVSVTAGLILQGELDGALGAGSTLTKLVYGTRRTDLVNVSSLTSLTVHIDDGEFRLDQVTSVANFGLCKGNVVLFEAGTAEQNTLTVNDFLTVKDGTLSLDTNEPGSIGTDETKPNAAATDGYILKYVTEGERMASSEWSAHARKVAIDHKDAVIIVTEAKSLVEGVHIFNGHLHLKGDGSHLTVGMPVVSGVSPFVMVDNAELHSNGNNVMVHGTVTVATGMRNNQPEVGKIVTGGGELHVLGTTTNKLYNNESAMATVGVKGTIDVGMGALQLGPAYEEPTNGLEGDARPDVILTLNKSDKGMGAVTGKVFVPKGSKETRINGEAFDTVVLDGTGNAKKDANGAGNWGGGLYFHDRKVTIDSLAAMNDAAVEFYDQTDPKTDAYAIEIKKDVALTSARIYVNGANTLKFGGNLTFGETGGMRVWDDAKVTVMGDFTQNAGSQHAGHQDGVGLAGSNTLTVMGDFMVADGAHRFESNANTDLVLKGDFHFAAVKTGSDKALAADLEFSGTESQMASAGVDLGHVVVNNSKGIVLADSVMQGGSSTLTLTRGIISGMYPWTVKNAGIEEDVRGRNNALMTCATDASCASVIKGGSRRAHASAGVARHVMYGNSGGGELSGGYLFPVGGMNGDRAHYRPLVLQLEDDLSEAMPATVTSMMASDDMMPSWPADNILVPIQGGLLTLDAHANIFWKVELKEAVDQNPHIRIAAGGLVNVFDDSRLRMVQWDCDWSNPRLAGTQIVGTDEDSFAENGYVNGVLNLTQESVDVGTCAILGVAANGLENPIHRDEITGGLAEVQFIHNAVIPVPVDVSLDGAPLTSGLTFQNATGYTMVSAGSHEVRFQPLGVPAEQGITVELPTLQADKSYAVIAHGTLVSNAVKTIETRKTSTASNMVEAILVHGSGDASAVNVNLLDPYDSNQLERIVARQLAFDQTTKYLQFDPDFVNLQVTGADNMEIAVFQLDLSGRQGEAVILNLSNLAAALEVYGVDVNGDRVSSFVVTDVIDTEELPTEFTLHGNYPNPFNPSTRIQFDLPETAQVSLQIVDMLGREVMTLPAKEFEAGANRSIELNAVNLASGTYLYRMIATGAESRYVKTGRMTLVK